jgi:hypothetical protein
MNEQEPTRIDVEVFDNNSETAHLRIDTYEVTTSSWGKNFTSMSAAKQYLTENGFRYVGSDKFYV